MKKQLKTLVVLSMATLLSACSGLINKASSKKMYEVGYQTVSSRCYREIYNYDSAGFGEVSFKYPQFSSSIEVSCETMINSLDQGSLFERHETQYDLNKLVVQFNITGYALWNGYKDYYAKHTATILYDENKGVVVVLENEDEMPYYEIISSKASLETIATENEVTEKEAALMVIEKEIVEENYIEDVVCNFFYRCGSYDFETLYGYYDPEYYNINDAKSSFTINAETTRIEMSASRKEFDHYESGNEYNCDFDFTTVMEFNDYANAHFTYDYSYIGEYVLGDDNKVKPTFKKIYSEEYISSPKCDDIEIPDISCMLTKIN